MKIGSFEIKKHELGSEYYSITKTYGLTGKIKDVAIICGGDFETVLETIFVTADINRIEKEG